MIWIKETAYEITSNRFKVVFKWRIGDYTLEKQEKNKLKITLKPI